MALTCGFYNSVDGDRKYDATQFASLFDGVITDGVVAAVGDFFATTPGGGMVVNVGSGRAWFNRTWTYSDAKIPLTLDASDLLYDRIDAVVLEIDTSVAVRDNSIKVVKGTPAQEPTNPVLTNEGDIYQYALAYVRVKASSIEVGAGDITINVGKEGCPFVTSIVETPELEVLFAQWDAQFKEWFKNVQSQLEGDIAANLQRQIDSNKTAIDDLRQDTDDKIEKLTSDDTLTIGDLLYTARTTVGKKFLLCNGSAWSRDMYPELSSMFPSTISGTWNENLRVTFTSIPNGNSIPVGTGCLYANEKIVYMSCCFKGSAYEGKIHYNTTVGGSYTEVSVARTTSSKGMTFRRFVYVNGYYVICGQKENSATIWYATDPAGPWASTTIKDAQNISDNNYVANDIAFDGTNYIIAGKVYRYDNYGRGVIWYASGLNASSWTEKELWKSDNSLDSDTQALTVACGNGQIMVGGLVLSQNRTCTATHSYSNSVYSSFINKRDFSGSSSVLNASINIIRYLNSNFISGGTDGYSAFVSASDEPYSLSSRITVWSSSQASTDANHGVHALDFDENEKQYVFGGSKEETTDKFICIVGRVAVSLQTNTLQTKVLETSEGSTYRKDKVNGIAVTPNHRYIAAYNYANAYAIGKNIQLDQFNVPSISANNVHVYIKAKDE